MRIKVPAGGVKSNDKSEECAAAIVLFYDNDSQRERTSESRGCRAQPLVAAHRQHNVTANMTELAKLMRLLGRPTIA